MSQNQQSSYGLGRKQGGGSVKRARDMLRAGVRAENSSQSQGSRGIPPPKPTYGNESGDIEIGYRVQHDPRGPVPILPIQGLSVPKHTVPPPTSRRGPPQASTHLSVNSASPAPEENSKKSRKKKESFASSTVIPSSWGSGPHMSTIIDCYTSEPEEPKRKRDSVTHLREASMGKRGKASLRTFNKPETEAPLLRAKFNKSNDSSLAHSTVERPPSFDSVSTDADSIDLEKEILAIENEQKARSIGIGLGLGVPGAGMSSRKPNSHRPPRLDMAAVRAAEGKGSLTSLPDLIRRATRVASNLERGNTASRLGILDMFDMDKGKRGSNNRTSASLSDILASFPPPRTDTPVDSSVRASWPFPPPNAEKSRLRHMRVNSEDEYEEPGTPTQRLCGMSRRVFTFVFIAVICTIGAAVLIPIFLVAIPRERERALSAANTTVTCAQRLPCMNGGVSIETGTTCSCVCVDGYSGAQCDRAGDGSCTTTEISQSNNATIGNSLPGLFAHSENYYDIPLNETQILSLFNANNVSCTVQNALVSFGGVSSKHRRQPSPTEPGTEAQIKRGSYVPPILSVPTATATTEAAGAIMAATGTTTTAPAASTASASTTSTAASASVSVNAAVTETYEFASVAVLYLFEHSQNFNTTSRAQHDIDLYLLSQPIGTASNLTMNVDMPETFVLSFSNLTITWPNGTVVGGGNGTVT